MQIEHALIGSHNSAVCSAEPLDLAVVVSQLAAYCSASLRCYIHVFFLLLYCFIADIYYHGIRESMLWVRQRGMDL